MPNNDFFEYGTNDFWSNVSLFQANDCCFYFLIDPTDSEVMGQPHAMVEKKLGLL